MMPWKLYADAAAYIFTWLIGYSSLMGAIGGMLIADYWVLRRCRLSLPICSSWMGATRYANGVNRRRSSRSCWPSCQSSLASSAPRLTPGGQVANPTIFDSLYTYAWFVTFALAFGIYLALMPTLRNQPA